MTVATPVLISILLVLTVGGSSDVRVVGQLRSIHREGDASARLRLDTVVRQHLYAIGPVADLQGEIVINDGELTISRVVNGTVQTHHDATTSAALLAYGVIEQWTPLCTTDGSTTLDGLATLLKRHSSSDDPVWIKITTTVEHLDWHVIHWPSGTPIDALDHKRHAAYGSDSTSPITIIGVYAPAGQGVITHHASPLHLHALTERGEAVHIESVTLPSETQILVPD